MNTLTHVDPKLVWQSKALSKPYPGSNSCPLQGETESSGSFPKLQSDPINNEPLLVREGTLLGSDGGGGSLSTDLSVDADQGVGNKAEEVLVPNHPEILVIDETVPTQTAEIGADTETERRPDADELSHDIADVLTEGNLGDRHTPVIEASGSGVPQVQTRLGNLTSDVLSLAAFSRSSVLHDDIEAGAPDGALDLVPIKAVVDPLGVLEVLMFYLRQ